MFEEYKQKELTQNFVKIEDLFKYLKDFIKSNSNKLELELENICCGDRYYNENGESINFTVAGKKYRVGYSYITEDDDDWGQAECYQVHWCDCDDRTINASEVLDVVKNFESIEREYKLNQLI